MALRFPLNNRIGRCDEPSRLSSKALLLGRVVFAQKAFAPEIYEGEAGSCHPTTAAANYLSRRWIFHDFGAKLRMAESTKTQNAKMPHGTLSHLVLRWEASGCTLCGIVMAKLNSAMRSYHPRPINLAIRSFYTQKVSTKHQAPESSKNLALRYRAPESSQKCHPWLCGIVAIARPRTRSSATFNASVAATLSAITALFSMSRSGATDKGNTPLIDPYQPPTRSRRR